MNSLPMRRNPVLAVLLAALLAGCSTSRPATADKTDIRSSLRPIVGTSLIGAKGATPLDQDKIDDTVAGLCGAQVWAKSECTKHGQP
jgi:type IV pilus biogenesis protein CpaD/CtpE